MIEFNYLTIQGWMLEKLDLKGTELLIYALIYGFCQAKNKTQISLAYIAKWTGCKRRAIIDNLNKLEAKKLIRREQKNGQPTNYFINWKIIEEVKQKLSYYKNDKKSSSAENARGSAKNAPVTSAENAPHKNINNIYSDNGNYYLARTRASDEELEKDDYRCKKGIFKPIKRIETEDQEEERKKKIRELKNILAYDWTYHA